MNGFVIILAAMHLAVPVHCYKSQQAYDAHAREMNVIAHSVAYYVPDTAIVLSPDGCKDVLMPNLEGADTIAHELAHHWQWVNTHSMNEQEATKIAYWSRRMWLRRLEKFLGRKQPKGPGPTVVVRLNP